MRSRRAKYKPRRGKSPFRDVDENDIYGIFGVFLRLGISGRKKLGPQAMYSNTTSMSSGNNFLRF